MNKIALGMGSNLHHSLSFFEAFFTLNGYVELASVSRLSTGDAVGSIGSPVSNLVVVGHTSLSLEALSREIKRIEREVNTMDKPGEWYSLDIDVLFFNDGGSSSFGKEVGRSYYIELVYSLLFN
ncbi:2-amino-4-hydroxy-6-hydroxymethyldihydropteridine diphosphokinase [Vibrio ostreicida]|uniref:2-amino-4-hydroxy-6- hydroxymethyldihydropteridine diphosphokinase n=1 Tax=Vibrio ostreicida TaxID=526588 RepID=UPI003B5A4263